MTYPTKRQLRAMHAKKHTKQLIYIKFPTEKAKPYLHNQTVFEDKILSFEGKLRDGRSVIKMNKNRWVYIV